MHILGITGGIATGKSTVTRVLAELGAPTVSADALARELLAPGTDTAQAVLDVFPDCADAGAINRRALGHLVFANPAARAHLEALTHPAIIAALQTQIAAWREADDVPTAAAEIPLLYEAGLEALVDKIIVVTCAEQVQIARLRDRLGIDEAEARRLIAAQWPLAEKVAKADIVITTNETLEATRRQVEAFWTSLPR